MKKNTLGKVLAVAAVSIVALQAAIAAPVTSALIDKEFDGALGKFLAKKFCKRIDATSEQTEKITKLVMDTRDETRPTREQLRQGLVQLSSLMVSDEATDDQIKQKVGELRALHEKVMDMRMATLLKARRVLTHEQREQINKRLTNLLSGDFQFDKLRAFRGAGENDVSL